MNFQLLSVFLIVFSVCSADYYWKDFYGDIPKDAFPGGLRPDGVPTYIGQTFMEAHKKVFPTIIEEGNKYAYIGLSGKATFEIHNKILCSSNHSLFRWIPTNVQKMKYLTECPQIYGGVDTGALLTIGRANHLGRTITGRVADNAVHKWHGLWIHDANFNNMHVSEFEVLTYNCTNPWAEEVP